MFSVICQYIILFIYLLQYQYYCLTWLFSSIVSFGKLIIFIYTGKEGEEFNDERIDAKISQGPV